MAIDINEDVKAWGGFSVNDFWTGLIVLVLITAVALWLSLQVSGLLAAVWEALVGGSFMALWVYRLGLPKGFLLRRFKQEGKFLFFKVPGVEGPKVFFPPSYERGERFVGEGFGNEGAAKFKKHLTSSLFRTPRPIDGFLVLDEKDVVACFTVTSSLNPLTAHSRDLEAAEARFRSALETLRAGEKAQIVLDCRRYAPGDDIETMVGQTSPEAAPGFRGYYPEVLSNYIEGYCGVNMVPEFRYSVFFSYKAPAAMPGTPELSLKHMQAEVARRAEAFTRQLADSRLVVSAMTKAQIVDYLDQSVNPTRLSALPETALDGGTAAPFDPGAADLLYRSTIVNAVPKTDRTYSFIMVGRKYIRSCGFTRPPMVGGGLHAAVSDLMFGTREFRLVYHVEGVPQERVAAIIQKKRASAAGAVAFGGGRNTQQQEEQMAEFDELLRAHARKEAYFVRFNSYLTVFEDTEAEVHKSMAELGPSLGEMVPGEGMYRQIEYWQSGLPFAEDKGDAPFLAQSQAIAPLFPFYELRTTSPEGGVLLGFSQANQPCFFDPWSKGVQNGNVFVTGQAGSGKSYLINNILNRLGPKALDVSIIDKAKSYKNTCMAQGGDYVELDLQGSHSVNVWDVMDFDPKLEADGLNDLDRSGTVTPDKVDQVAGCAEILLAEDGSNLPKLDKSIVLSAIAATYKRRLKVGVGGLVDPASVPTFSDLADTLRKEIESGKDEEFVRTRKELLQKLSIVTEGTLAGLANKRTTLQANGKVRVFDISNLPDNPTILGTAVYILAGWLYRHWRRNKVKGLRQVAVIDEMYFFMQFASGRTLLDNLARRSRHLGLMPFFATQQLTDVLQFKESESILNNCQTQFLFKQERNVVEQIREVLKLTDQECGQLETLRQVRGEFSNCFFVYGSIGRNVLTIRPDPVTRWLNTTEPTYDMPRIKKALEANGGDIWAAVENLVNGGN